MAKQVYLDLIQSDKAQHSKDANIISSSKGSYADVMHRILIHKKWTEFPIHMIAGMTATVFRLVVDRRLTEESISAYNWMAENFVAADFIGVTVSQAAGFSFAPTFPLYQKQALVDIKTSIDRGVGAIVWHDQFVIAAGYDDVEQVLLLCNSEGQNVTRLPYDSFGRNSTPYWYYQVLESCRAVDLWEVCKESLIQAVYKWEIHDYMLPTRDYACGSAAYSAMASALETSVYDPRQAAAVLRYYCRSREIMASYVAGLGYLSDQMAQVIQEYRSLSDLYLEMIRWVDHCDLWDVKEPECVQSVIALLHQARETEQRAIDAIKQAFPETIGNRFKDVGLR